MPRLAAILIISLSLGACSPKKNSCDYPLFDRAWNKIRTNYVMPVENKSLFTAALKVTSHELGKETAVPEYERDALYTPARLWLLHIQLTGKLPSSDGCYAMIKEMVTSLNSRHSIYLRPDEKFLNELARNESGGVGFFFFKEDEEAPAIIYKVFRDTDAEQSGLEPGDIIVMIDGAPTAATGTGQIAYQLRGKIGSFVELTVLKRSGETQSVELTREKRDQGVYCEDLPGEIAYCAIVDFDRKALKDTFLNELWQKTHFVNTNRLILDLRFNPGGYVSQALNISELWVGDKIIIKVKNHLTTREVRGDRKRPLFNDAKTVILVNRHTASASEIVIGALTSYGLAITVGEQTYGKGEIQNVVTFDDKSRLIIVSLYWFPPNGDDINKVGFNPAYKVKTDADDLRNGRDPEMETAIELVH